MVVAFTGPNITLGLKTTAAAAVYKRAVPYRNLLYIWSRRAIRRDLKRVEVFGRSTSASDGLVAMPSMGVDYELIWRLPVVTRQRIREWPSLAGVDKPSSGLALWPVTEIAPALATAALTEPLG